MNRKVSFDFDRTLSKKEVQVLASRYISDGYEVHVVTARNDDANVHKYLDPTWRTIGNRDLWEVVDNLGIDKNNVHFTNGLCKIPLLEQFMPLFHLDDDEMQLHEINLAKLPISAISVLMDDWEERCDTVLKKEAI